MSRETEGDRDAQLATAFDRSWWTFVVGVYAFGLFLTWRERGVSALGPLTCIVACLGLQRFGHRLPAGNVAGAIELVSLGLLIVFVGVLMGEPGIGAQFAVASMIWLHAPTRFGLRAAFARGVRVGAMVVVAVGLIVSFRPWEEPASLLVLLMVAYLIGAAAFVAEMIRKDEATRDAGASGDGR